MTDRTNGKHGQKQNRLVLKEAKELLGDVDPGKVTLVTMQRLETMMNGNETTRSVKCTIIRAFFKLWMNRNAHLWKMKIHQRPRQDIIHLSEEEIAHLKATAAQMGVFYELFTSLGVDNGLRPNDMLNLTVQNAVEFLQRGWSVIKRKGRNGGKLVWHYLHADTFSPLTRYLDMRQELTEPYGVELQPLFIMETNYRNKGNYYLQPLHYNLMADEHLRLQEATGIVLKLKDERATFGYRARMAKIPIEDVAELMTHDSINTSFRHYIGDTTEMKKNVMRIGSPSSVPTEMMAVISRNPARSSQH